MALSGRVARRLIPVAAPSVRIPQASSERLCREVDEVFGPPAGSLPTCLGIPRRIRSETASVELVGDANLDVERAYRGGDSQEEAGRRR